MKIYIDSSTLVKLYYPEPESGQVEAFVKQYRIIIPFTYFHELEVMNAIQLKEYRKELTRAEKIGIINSIHEDKQNGILQPLSISYPSVFEKSLKLSSDHACEIGVRTLDIIHAATALCGGFTHFLSHDDRQNSLAEKAGLSIAELPAGSTKKSRRG